MPKSQATFAPMDIDGHRHQPEIERCCACTGIAAPLVFTPHVVPLARGMLADSYAVFEQRAGRGDVRRAYARRTRARRSCGC